MINLKIKTNGTVRNPALPYPGQYNPDIIEKNSVVTVSEVTEPESLKYMEGHEWKIMPNDYKCHYKAAIEKRNRWLAENCDLMLGYVKRDSDGAYKCFRYAIESGVLLINIADKIEQKD